MNERMSTQLIRGRPFGGADVLYRRLLGSIITYYGCSDDSRVVVIKLVNGSQTCWFLVFTFHVMIIDLNICIAFNRYLVILNLLLRRILAISVLSLETSILNARLVMSGYVSSLSSVCDDLDPCNSNYSYCHVSLDQKSLIGHVLVPHDLKSSVHNYSILCDGLICLITRQFTLICLMMSVSPLVGFKLPVECMSIDGIKVMFNLIICTPVIC